MCACPLAIALHGRSVPIVTDLYKPKAIVYQLQHDVTRTRVCIDRHFCVRRRALGDSLEGKGLN
eukprot:212801-Alexandrium_andersonii.AAC.1